MNSYFFTIAIQNPGSGSLKYCRVFLVCNEWHEPEVPKVLHLRNHVTHLKIKYYSTNVLAKFQNRRSPSHFFHLSIFWRLRWIIINNAFIFLVKTETLIFSNYCRIHRQTSSSGKFRLVSNTKKFIREWLLSSSLVILIFWRLKFSSSVAIFVCYAFSRVCTNLRPSWEKFDCAVWMTGCFSLCRAVARSGFSRPVPTNPG